MDQDNGRQTAWQQVGLAAITQNVATGLAFGSFGTLILAIEKEYGADRATSSLALSVLVISLSATASLLGRFLHVISIRKTMMAGAIAGSVGFLTISFAQSAWQLLAAYMLLLGPATAMLGVLPSSALASAWTPSRRRGLALGIVNMPVLVMIVPLSIAPVLETEGVRIVFRILALVEVALIPILFLIRDPVAKPIATANVIDPDALPPRASEMLRSSRFWIVIVALGLIVGAGLMKLTHFVPLLMEQGRTFNEANTLLAISGGAGIFGSFLFGILADKVGGTKALICNAVIQAAMWTIFLAPVSFGILLVDAIIVGACGAGVQSAFSVLLTRLFGERSFNLALGLAALMTLPFLFGLSPLASILYQIGGSYHLPMALMIGGFLASAFLFMTQIRNEAKVDAAAETKGN